MDLNNICIWYFLSMLHLISWLACSIKKTQTKINLIGKKYWLINILLHSSNESKIITWFHYMQILCPLGSTVSTMARADNHDPNSEENTNQRPPIKSLYLHNYNPQISLDTFGCYYSVRSYELIHKRCIPTFLYAILSQDQPILSLRS